MTQEIFDTVSRKFSRFGMDLRRAMRENTPLPKSLVGLWPKEKPSSAISETSSSEELWQHYLYLDGQREREHPGGLAGEWNRYFHEYMLVSKGLSSGAMEYGKAREFLHDALAAGKKQNLSMIYLFWLGELKDYEGDSIDAWNDRQIVARRAYESIREEKSPTYRAELTALFVEAFQDRMPNEESSKLITEAVGLLLKKLPKPADVPEVYARSDIELKSPKTSYKTHGNDMHWMLSVFRVGRNLGLSDEVKPLTDYFIDVLKVYDPAIGDTYFTGYLLYFAMNNDAVPKKMKDYFRGRVASVIAVHGDSLGGKDKILSDLVYVNLDLGYYKSAIKALKKIKGEGTMLSAAATFMKKVGDGVPDPNSLYEDFYLPLVAKSWHHNLPELKKGKSEIAKDERDMWMLQWTLSGCITDDTERKTRIFNRDDVIAYIKSGRIDGQLDTITDAAGFPGDERLVKAVRGRVSNLFKVARGEIKPKRFDRFSVNSDTRNAIEAEFALRKKGL